MRCKVIKTCARNESVFTIPGSLSHSLFHKLHHVSCFVSILFYCQVARKKKSMLFPHLRTLPTSHRDNNTNFALHPSTVDPGCLDVCSQWPLVDLTTYQLWLLHTWSTSASSGNCTGHTASNRSHHFYYTPTKALNSAASENRLSILVQHTILTWDTT